MNSVNLLTEERNLENAIIKAYGAINWFYNILLSYFILFWLNRSKHKLG